MASKKKTKTKETKTLPFIADRKQIVEMNKRVMGIDPSLTRTGWCVLSGKSHTSGSFGSLSYGPKRLRELYDKLEDIVSEFCPTLVMLEGYSYGSANNRESLAEWGGLLRVLLWDRKIPTLIVAPTTLKKFVLSDPSQEKDQMILSLYKRYGVEFSNNDEADAYALAQMGRSRMEAEMIDSLSASRSGFSGTQRMLEAALTAAPYIFPELTLGAAVRSRSSASAVA